MKTRRIKFYILLALLLLIGIGTNVNAQTGLVYGDRIFGEVTATQPQVFYTFGATEGDWVTARVIGASVGMMPTMGVSAPTGQQVAFNASDDFDVVAGSARVSYLVEQTGVYTIQIGALPDSSGGFLLVLDGVSGMTFATLSDAPTTATLLAGEAQVFAIDANPNAPITLNVNGEGVYVVKLIDPNGEYVAIVRSGALAGTALAIPSGEGQYLVLLESTEDAEVTLSLGGDVSTSTTGTTSPASTEEAQTQTTAPSGVCTASSNGAVNIRSGNGTNFNAFATLNVGEFLVVTGRTANNWYQLDVNGTTGYVFADVVIPNGPCGDVPTVAGETAPTTSSTPVPPSATEETGSPTQEATTTGGNNPTQPPPPTESVQEAPIDGNELTFNVDRENGGTFFNDVSTPNGDTIDRINAVVNLTQSPPTNSRTVQYTLSCSGTGTENIRWTRSSPNAQQYFCGDTITWRHAHPQSAMSFFVFFADGSPASYVNYTLTAVITGS